MENFISYFRNLWKKNKLDLENQCITWEDECKKAQIPDEVCDEIRTIIGCARLLMNQKLAQFKGLIDDSELKRGEQEITESDLQGFWDMVYFEVEKINKGFMRLEKCKSNQWEFIEENPVKPVQKKLKEDAKNSSKMVDLSKSRALAAKQRLAEAKKKMLEQRNQEKENFVENSQSNGEEINKIQESKKNDNAMPSSSKKKTGKRNYQVISQNKENVSSGNSNALKNASNTTKKTNAKPEASKTKSKKEPKEIIPLQCITRSQKRAMLDQQNAV